MTEIYKFISLRRLIATLLVLTFPMGISADTVANLSFQPIFYPAKSADLNGAAKEGLQRVYKLLQNNPKAKLKLQGHVATDEADVADLATNRAKSAMDYLLKLGLAAERISVVPGSDDSQTSSVAQENRRVEFVFFEEGKEKSAESGLEEIEIVYWNTLYHCLYQIAAQKGYFEQQGFKPKLIATNHSYSDQVKHACGLEPFLERGAGVFSGAVCGGSPHEAIAKGIPIVVIGGMLAGGSFLVAKKELGTKLRADWKNFKGITIGRPRGTILTAMVVSYQLSKHGIDPKKDVKWKLFNTHEEILEALATGKVDAADTYAPLHLTAIKKYNCMVVYNTVELFPYHPCCRIITTQAKLKADRSKYVRFLKAIINAHQFFVQQPAKAIDIVARATGYAPDEVRATLTDPAFMLNPDPLKNGFVKFWRMMLDTGFLESKADVNKYIDTTVYEDALKELLKEQPQNPYYAHMMKQFKAQNT